MKRIYDDGALSSSEKSRMRSDRFACIDNQLNEAISKINWERRNKAEKDIVTWVNTYSVGVLLEDEPPKMGQNVLNKMLEALESHKNYMILMGRGSGKSCYVLLCCLYSIITSMQKFLLIVSNNQRAAQNLLNDLWRIISEPNTFFANDYPEVCLPFQLCNGSFRRRQYYNGKATLIARNAGTIVFPRIISVDGTPTPSSEAIIATRGYTSGLRGLRSGKQRITAVILDDIQDSTTAGNPEQVQKILDIINKDIMPMGGKERLSVLQTATPIQVDDVVDKIQHDTNWITQVYPAIMTMPKNTALWDKYFKIFDNENVNELTHDESLRFYRDNFKQMNEGAEVFNPTRFSTKDGHLTALQKLLELKHVIGDSAFSAEYLMKPAKVSFSIDIKPKDIIENQVDVPECELPSGYQFAIASSDLNLSFCISTTIVGFKVDGSAHVLKHIFRRCHVKGQVADAEYNSKVYQLLVEHGNELNKLGIPLKGWAIDCNGQPFDTVTSFCNNSLKLCGMQACGFIGKASHIFNPNIRSRLRNEQSRTVLCGDVMEQTRSGAGKRWVIWDSDMYRERVQTGFLKSIGSQGAITLYKGTDDEHVDYALQICNEKLKLKRQRQDGRIEYYWKSSNDHDMLDSTAQALAAAAQFGISPQNFSPEIVAQKRMLNHVKSRPRIKFV